MSFKKIYKKITDFFLEGFRDAPLDVRRKTQYILNTDLVISFIFIISIPLHIAEGSGIYKIIGDVFGIVSCFASIWFLRKTKLTIAAYLPVAGAMGIIMIHNVLNDYLVIEQFHYLRLYVTIAQLFILYLILGLLADSKRHILFYLITAMMVMAAHFVVIVSKSYSWEVLEVEIWVAYIIGNFGILMAAYISYLIFSTSELMIKVAKNEADKFKKQNEELENIVARRTHDLRNTNDDLKHFAYAASHDLKEPLRMIGSFLGLIDSRLKKQYGGDQDMTEFIGYAIDGTKRMELLINNLLSYSRLNTQANPFEPIDLNEVMDIVKINLKIAIEENDAQVLYDHLPVVMADRNQMQQLFQNLIFNSIKYRHNTKTPVIHISTLNQGAHVQVAVTDNGIGIEKEYYDRIFQVFQRLHSRAEYEGTGMGLAICKKIVERHQGKIWVESEVGIGTTFYLTLLRQQKTNGVHLNGKKVVEEVAVTA